MRTLIRSTLALAACIACSSTLALAQSTRLAGEVELARLVDLCATRLNLDIQYDPGDLREKVTLRLGDDVTDDELWRLTNRLLAAKGLSTVRMPEESLLSIVRIGEARKLSRVSIPGDALGNQLVPAGYTASVLQTKHRPPSELTKAIKPILSTGGTIEVIDESGLLLLADLTPHVKQAESLLHLIDVPGQATVAVPYPTEFVPAAELTTVATSAMTVLTSGTASSDEMGKAIASPDGVTVYVIAVSDLSELWLETLNRFDVRQPVETRTYIPDNFDLREVAELIEQVARDSSPRGSGNLWKLVIEDLSGAVVVSATPSEHANVAKLMQRLEDAPPQARRPMRAFKIRNRGINDITTVLQDLLDTGAFDSAGPDGPDADATDTPGLEVADNSGTRFNSPDDDRQSALELTADEGTSTLIAVGDARILAQLEMLIEQLDVRQPQVMIDAMVISLTDSDTLDLGVELRKLETSGNTLISLGSLFGLSSGNLAEGNVASSGTGFTGVVLSPGDFSVVIRALESLNDGRSLSMPKILVGNNQHGTLDSVLQEPITSINASDTVATTTFAGTQDAGTQIEVTPQIAEGDHLVLEYSVTLSAFVGDSAAAGVPPTRQQNSITSTVTIPDGHTIVVGGLEITNEGESETRIPFLGSIPGVGELFKSQARSHSRTRFYVFLRASLLRNQSFEDLKYVSGDVLDSVGLDDGWPTVEPRVIR